MNVFTWQFLCVCSFVFICFRIGKSLKSVYSNAVLLKKQFRGPKTKNFFQGNLDLFEKEEKIMQTILNLTQSYGGNTGMFLLFYGTAPTLMICSGSSAQKILDRSIDRQLSKGYEHEFKPWLGNSILLSTGIIWEKKRKAMAPTFDSQALQEDIFLTIEQMTNDQIHQWNLKIDAENNGEIVLQEFHEACLAFSFRIISQTVLGKTFDQVDLMIEKFQMVLTEIEKRSYHPFTFPNWFYLYLTSDGRKFKSTVDFLNEKIYNIVQQEKTSSNSSTQKTLLQMLITTTDLTSKEITGELMTFLFAGHETTATALSWTIYLLARHPKIVKKMRNETENILGKHLEKFSFGNLSQLDFLYCIIQESLRLYPPQPAFVRCTNEEVTLRGMTIPAETEISICPYAIHRDQTIYKDADQFIPERFSRNAEESDQYYHVEKKKRSFSFMPFSAGLRNCIGRSFALLELKISLILFFHYFDFFFCGDPKEVFPIPAVTLRPSSMEIKIKKRAL